VVASVGFVLLGISAALMVYEALFRQGPELVVSRVGDGSEVVRLPLRHDPTWEIQWTHSVAGIVVRDIFAWRDERMLLTDTLTPLLDVAGLGHSPGRGELRDDGDGGYWIAAIDEPIAGNAYTLRVGGAAAPTVLVHGARSYPLSDDHAGARLRLEVDTP
jgi:hypothetical protein